MLKQVKKRCLGWILDPILQAFMSSAAKAQRWSHNTQASIAEDEKEKQWNKQVSIWDQNLKNVKKAFQK
jgi:hypothetical protein